MKYVFFLILCLLLASPVQAGPIYVYTDDTGAIRFTSKPPPKGVTAKVFSAKKPKYSLFRRGRKQKLFHKKYQSIIKKVSQRYQVSEPLIRAVIHTESAFNPRAVSPKGARGLMQIMPFHDKNLGIEDPFEPAQNIEAGVRLLAELGKRYRNNLSLVLAAYNAGEEAVSRYGGVPPYKETQHYVKRVLRLRNEYRSVSS